MSESVEMPIESVFRSQIAKVLEDPAGTNRRILGNALLDGSCFADEHGFTSCVVMVSPWIAERWLKLNHQENRSVNVSRVSAYQKDMMAGHWPLTGEAVKFGKDGRLHDGQHRLHAIVKAGVTVPMLVVFGLDENCFHVIDHGMARPLLWWADRNHRAIAVALMTRRCGRSNPSLRLTEDEAEEFYRLHHDAIAFASSLLPRTRGIDANIRSAYARAFYHVPHDVLRNMASVMSASAADESPRRQLIASKLMVMLTTSITMASTGMRHDMDEARYLKTERAILAFWHDEGLDKLYRASGEQYPLPGDVAAKP